MNNWCGPMWNDFSDYTLWQSDSEWSDRGNNYGFQSQEDAKRVISLFKREEVLSKDEYAWLCERGYVKTNGDYNGQFFASWQIVILASKEIKERLLAIGERIKEKYKNEFDKIKAPYIKAALNSVPAHLQKNKEYEFQFLFNSDGCFLLHCIVALLNNGKLKLPTKEQRKALTTIIIHN